MKQKIKEAITQGYKNLGVPESVVDGLAALGVTVVKDESEIASFVQGEAVKGVMKSYQSETDKVRTEYSTKLKGLEAEKAELEAKLDGNQPPQKDPDSKPAEDDKIPAWAQQLIDSNKSMSEQLATFKAEQSAKTALSTAKATFMGNDYVKKYAEEADTAWEITNEIRKYNPNWTAEEIVNDAMSRFNKAVAKKGVDTTKPFESDGGGGASEAETNAAFAAEIRNALGMNKE